MFKISVLILVLCLVKTSKCTKLLKCSTMEFPGRCPQDTMCIQLVSAATTQQGTDDGECQCKQENYEFNIDYNGLNSYCVHTDARNRVPGSSSNGFPPAITDNDPSDPTTASARQRLPSSHHVISGILISIFLVSVFILVVIILKRLQLRRRFRELRMNQRSRPLYEDVQLGTDADDPPLI